MDTLSVMYLLQPLQEAGTFHIFRKHALRHLRSWIREFPDRERFCEERFYAGIAYGDRLCGHWIPGDLHCGADQRGTDLVFPAFEAEAGTLIHLAGIMVQERLPDDPGIQIFQRAGVTVELLAGRDALCRDIDPLTFIVFPDTVMGLIVVIVLDEQPPPVAGFCESLYLLCAAFGDIAVDQAVIDLDLSFALARIRLCPEMADPKPRERVDQLFGDELASIIDTIPISE